MTDFSGDSIKEIKSLYSQAIIVLANLGAVEVGHVGKKTPARESCSLEKLLARKIVLKDDGKQSLDAERLRQCLRLLHQGQTHALPLKARGYKIAYFFRVSKSHAALSVRTQAAPTTEFAFFDIDDDRVLLRGVFGEPWHALLDVNGQDIARTASGDRFIVDSHNRRKIARLGYTNHGMCLEQYKK
jgi:hypothetical protein